jgi:hypothetical protein
MALTVRNARLAAIVIGIAVAAALAPAAVASADGSSSDDRFYVNPGTGYATPAPAADETIRVNPSTGYASVAERSASEPVAAARPTEPAVATERSSGFDWASAGIGAAGGAALALILMVSLGVLGVRWLRRAPRAEVAPGDGPA